jgi:hypothetical protein
MDAATLGGGGGAAAGGNWSDRQEMKVTRSLENSRICFMLQSESINGKE